MSNVVHINGARLHERIAFVDQEGEELAAILPDCTPTYDWPRIALAARAYDAGQVGVETAIAKLLHHLAPQNPSML